MRNKIILFAVAFLLLLNLSSAIVSVYQQTSFPSASTHITRTSNSVFWIYGYYNIETPPNWWDFLFPPVLTSQAVRDEIKSDELLEVEIDYSMYPQSWNAVNTGYDITNCSFTINYFAQKLNQSYVFYEEVVTENDTDVMAKKYFVRLPQRDGISVFMDCYFENESKRGLITPTELSIKLPTFECKSCQYYEWSVQQRQIVKAKLVGNNVVSIWSYIKDFVELNFEIILALFWFFLIAVLLIGISLMFIGIYYLFLFLRKLALEIR